MVVFSSLKEGKHSFDFEITPAFFESFDNPLIQNANIQVQVVLDKKVNMLEFDFEIKGKVVAECARCTDELIVPVQGKQHLIVKFGEDKVEQDDEILWIDENSYEIDLSQQVYEYIYLLLPIRNVHSSKKDCNPEVIEKLDKLSVKEEAKEIDPRWEELRKLKKD